MITFQRAYMYNTWFALFLLISIFATPVFADSDSGHDETAEKGMDEFFKGASQKNGWSIFYEGMTLQGKRIEIAGGPHWLSMHGGGCASCHGEKGQGGFTPMMCNKKTPPIYLKALMGSEHEHNGMKEKHTPYTIKTIRRALEFAINPAAERLDPRSEERRVGKEWRIGCSSRWSPRH